MRKIYHLTVISLILLCAPIFAQPQTIAFQGTAISSFGQLLTSQSISVRLSIFNDIAAGTAAYVETQTATTSGSGAFSVQVGSGTAVTGTYASINLMSGIHYLQVEIKPSGGSYSTISKGPIAQSVAVGSWQCGSSITVTHTAGAVAPVSKTVTYGTVTNIPGETTKCWITSNLGADHQATSMDDATETSAGWYWQFNRKQGYKNDGTTVTPTWTINNISENSDWLLSNDPCTIELGTGWRLPTQTEWTNVDATGNWTTWTGPWNSGLKLHAAGNLNSGSTLNGRGSNGYYWSSMQSSNSFLGWILGFDSGNSDVLNGVKAYGFNVRCIKDQTATSSLPTLTTTSISTIAQTTATGGGNVTADGGAAVSARGICWSTSANPSITDSHTTDGSGTGTFVSNLTGLSANTLYHVRAYAANSVGTAYGSDISFTTLAPAFVCGSMLTINHVAGLVAPVSKTVTYGTVTNIPGATTKCWITSNLGADHQANAVSDATEASAGWYWQFNRKQGYKHDGTTRIPNTTWIYPVSENSDWLTANDPCTSELGAGWRLPTSTEWTNVDATGNWTTWTGPWSSGLKLHAAGYMSYGVGALSDRGSFGDYWSSSQSDSDIGWFLDFSSGISLVDGSVKANGFSVRCIKDPTATSSLPTITTTSISAIAQNTATGGGNVTADGGAPVSARGICWSTSANPSNTDSHTADGSGIGTFVSNLTGLTANTLYHVRAYATNSVGTAYGSDISFTTLAPAFVCGSTLTINHVAGAVAPVGKTVTYGTVTNIPGETTKCWITSNLGADHQATAKDDATEASAGWYWQFNRKQGYKNDGTTRTPNTTWITSINENSDWLTANDPCTSELGTGWRLPTQTEWTNVDATGNWSDWNGSWNSGLKIHSAGYLDSWDGSLVTRGVYGEYLSSMQGDAANVWLLTISSSGSGMGNGGKAYGLSMRCIKE